MSVDQKKTGKMIEGFPESGWTRRRFDRFWSIAVVLFLSFLSVYLVRGNYCDYLVTDFRGYYAAAQIAGRMGVDAVYDPDLQSETQAALDLRCPDGTRRLPLIDVLVPYLPVFIPLFLPISWIDMTSSYLLWSLVNLVILLLYLRRFAIAITGTAHPIKLLQWVICFPVLANLALGQINVLLVMILGEFTLAFLRGKSYLSGAWLGLLLLKPHLLILLLPGLAIARRWQVVLGFVVSAIVLLTASLLLAGADGMVAWWKVIRSFGEPSFLSLPNMMNGRALAFNLARLVPGWVGWLLASALMVTVTVFVLHLWVRNQSSQQFTWLMLATLAGTFILSWHSNLYLLICLVQYFLVLDIKGQVSTWLLAAWIFGPPAIYFLVYFTHPALAHPALGMALLGFNIFLLGYSARRQVSILD
jgi:hypothetical protein